jgi:hypothetical protein
MAIAWNWANRVVPMSMKLSPKLLVFHSAVILLFTACPSEVWIPVAGSHRPAVVKGHVQFLEGPPERPHVVVGIITPPAGDYNTEADAVKGMSREAEQHGADAIYIESQTETGGWRFGSGFGGWSGGSFKELRFRAKAIVWK